MSGDPLRTLLESQRWLAIALKAAEAPATTVAVREGDHATAFLLAAQRVLVLVVGPGPEGEELDRELGLLATGCHMMLHGLRELPDEER